MWIKTLQRLIKMSLIQSSPPNSQLPVVVVLGSTATGKSKLAIDLASKFGGEVISADSMQVYTGLDVLTNKVTAEEMQGIPHHMIGEVERTEKFNVVNFRDKALPLVQNIIQAGKMPIIVGGTNYYIESLLWDVLISGQEELQSRKRKSEDVSNVSVSTEEINPIISLLQSHKGYVEEVDLRTWSNQELHSALQLEDPERAQRLHPNDRRKVIRSLQVKFQSGRKHSELIAEQCSPLCEDDDDERESPTTTTTILSQKTLGGQLRFPSIICLWIQADKEVLDTRIENRVENMIKLGLKQELDSYMDILRQENCNIDYEKGVLQSIGFKEFHSYLQLLPSDQDGEEGEKLFRDGIERLKVVTKQYARKQVKWISQRFLVPHRRQVPHVYKLDGNSIDAANWDSNVLNPAVRILNAYLQNKLDDPFLKLTKVPETDSSCDDLVARTCEICDNRVFIGSLQYEIHMKSGKHKRMMKKKLKDSGDQSSFVNDTVLTP